jgi:monoamine oxidase
MNRTAIRRFLIRNFALAKRNTQPRLALRPWTAGSLGLDRKPLSRRDFVGGALGVAMALPACRTLSVHRSDAKSTSSRRVVILGGGLAGLTAAYYLRQAGITASIYEALPTIGGRVRTQKPFNKDGMFLELGGEFVDPDQHHLVALASELGVQIEDYFDGNPLLQPDLFFLGGKIVDQDKLAPEFRVFVKLVEDDMKILRQGDKLILPTVDRPGPLPRLDQISLAEYLAEKKKQGLSAEFVKLIDTTYLSMYGLDTSEQSVYNLLTLVDTQATDFALAGDGEENKRIKGGSSQLTQALQSKVAASSPIFLEHRLLRIKDSGTDFVLDFEVSGKVKTVKADQVICTLPFSVLRFIEGVRSLALSRAKMTAIHQLGYATSAKFSLGFVTRKWRQKGNLLPPNLGNIYSDGTIREIRESSNNQKGASGILSSLLNGKQGAVVSKNITAETLDYLESFYPGIKRLTDGNHSLAHWPSEPFALGAFATPRVGHYGLMGGYSQPVELGGRLIFAGEHMSEDWGSYMEGAIATGLVAAGFV